jgi:hypothetical protein
VAGPTFGDPLLVSDGGGHKYWAQILGPGLNGPNLGEMYGNMRYGISQWDAADKGFDLTGTVTETSDSNFSHREQLSQSSEDLMRMDGGRKVGAVKFSAASLEELSRESESEFKVTHGAGNGFTIDKAEDEVKTNHNWMDKQISSRSEHREYAAPTSAPPTTMTALRTASPSSTQSLLGNAPAGSSLLSSATHTTFYYSPLSDVTKTVKNWIVPYESNGSPNAAPILYRYSDEVKVNVTAWVEKIGNVFNGSSTLRSKSTFTESDQGTIETYRGLERQEPNSFNNWTVTYVPIETLTGGITQSITHTKPSADNTITLPNQGTQTTVEPGGEHHSGTTTLSTYVTVLKPIVNFIGGFATETGYVAMILPPTVGNGSNGGENSLTQGDSLTGSDGSGTPDDGVGQVDVGFGEAPKIGRIHLPADWRGTWIGEKGNGTFKYSDIPYNSSRGIANLEVEFQDNHIKVGGFPEKYYLNGNREYSRVEVDSIDGSINDFDKADTEMREKLRKAGVKDWDKWTRPEGYTWNHAGGTDSKTLELVESDVHRRVAHKGPAALPRALAKNWKGKALGLWDVYSTAKDAVEFATPSKFDDSIEYPEAYYFLDETGSVFWISVEWGVFGNTYRKEYIDGPKAGERVKIDWAAAKEFQELGEAKYGKVVYDFFGRPYKFKPGTDRTSIRVYDFLGNEIGILDEDGFRRPWADIMRHMS